MSVTIKPVPTSSAAPTVQPGELSQAIQSIFVLTKRIAEIEAGGTGPDPALALRVSTLETSVSSGLPAQIQAAEQGAAEQLDARVAPLEVAVGTTLPERLAPVEEAVTNAIPGRLTPLETAVNTALPQSIQGVRDDLNALGNRPVQLDPFEGMLTPLDSTLNRETYFNGYTAETAPPARDIIQDVKFSRIFGDGQTYRYWIWRTSTNKVIKIGAWELGA